MPSAGAASPGNMARQRQVVGLTRKGFQEMGKAESFSDSRTRVADNDLPAPVAVVFISLFPSSEPSHSI
jgi:hypothetical protein